MTTIQFIWVAKKIYMKIKSNFSYQHSFQHFVPDWIFSTSFYSLYKGIENVVEMIKELNSFLSKKCF